jgi:hypothetical protein
MMWYLLGDLYTEMPQKRSELLMKSTLPQKSQQGREIPVDRALDRG